MLKKLYNKYVSFSVGGWVIFFFTMTAGTAICTLLKEMSTSDVHVPLIFVLCVLIISLTTDGYAYGFLASLVSVFEVNWAFTYPYMKLDFSIYGYPLTFLTMLAVGIASSTLGWHMKTRHRLELENEREKMRVTLLRSVSHDLRTPLTAISGSISAILEREDMPASERRKLLENARNDSEWLYRMVENLLSITRMSGDSTAGSIIKTDELLEEILADAAAKFKARHQEMQVEVYPIKEIVFVQIDPMLIEQTLMNLMDNALLHGESTTKITITVDNGTSEVAVHVIDNGRGINPLILDKLFDETIELQSHLSGDSNRFMGIGLSVCKTIVEAHGGRISAHNMQSGGAEFIFTLPKGERKDEYQG